jgi:hypothetical protein
MGHVSGEGRTVPARMTAHLHGTGAAFWRGRDSSAAAGKRTVLEMSEKWRSVKFPCIG